MLSGEEDTQLLQVRVFSPAIKAEVYSKQTQKAKEEGISNCPLCAVGDNKNNTKVYTISEMEADHVEAWSKGGDTSIENCQVLCKPHNRAKGNK